MSLVFKVLEVNAFHRADLHITTLLTAKSTSIQEAWSGHGPLVKPLNFSMHLLAYLESKCTNI